MTKVLVSVWLLAALGCLSVAQAEPPRIVVLGVTNHHHAPALANMHSPLAYGLEVALQQTGRFAVIERGALANMLRAGEVAGDDLLRDPERSLAGRQLTGVDYLVTGVLQGDALSTQATIKFIRAQGEEAGQVWRACTAVGVTVPYVDYLACDLAEEAANLFPLQGKVVSSRDDTVIINLGLRDGLRIGDELAIEKRGDEQRDGETGAVVFEERTLVGRVKVTEVQAAGSKARVLEQAPVGQGMTVSSVPAAKPPSEDGRRLLTVGEVATQGALDASVGKWAGSLLTSELAQRQKAVNIRILEREHLQRVFDEMGLAESGLFDRTKAVRAGRLLSASLLVGATLTKNASEFSLTARIIPEGTGEAQMALTRRGRDLEKLVGEVAGGIADLLRPAELRPLGSSQLDGRVAFNYDVVPAGQYRCLRAVAPPLVEYCLRNRSEASVLVRVSTSIVGYSQESVKEVTLGPGETRQLPQTPPLDLPQVASVVISAATQVRCKVELASGGPVLLEDSSAVQLLPARAWLARLPTRRTALPLVADQTIVEWIRNSASLEAIRAQGAQLCKLKRLYGYQAAFLNDGGWPTDTPKQQREAVRAQVSGLYQALLSQGISYVEDAALRFPLNAGQNVLLPDEVLSGRRANCLDGTILFASVLSPTFDPLLVLTDTHAFVGWRTWSGTESDWDVLDTTLLAVPGSTFEQALERGRQEAAKVGFWERLEQRGEKLEFDSAGLLSPAVPGVVVIDVRTAIEHLSAARMSD